jgi:hypothetical protein
MLPFAELMILGSDAATCRDSSASRRLQCILSLAASTDNPPQCGEVWSACPEPGRRPRGIGGRWTKSRKPNCPLVCFRSHLPVSIPFGEPEQNRLLRLRTLPKGSRASPFPARIAGLERRESLERRRRSRGKKSRCTSACRHGLVAAATVLGLTECALGSSAPCAELNRGRLLIGPALWIPLHAAPELPESLTILSPIPGHIPADRLQASQ